MKAAVFYGQGDIRIENVEYPDIIHDDDIIVKVSYCGICGSDITAYKTGNYVPGTIIGHEFSGIVVDTGKGVDNIVKGDRVVGSSIIPCGHCDYCLTGRPNLCRNSQLTGITINGAFAEYIRIPARSVFKIPDDLNLLTASLAEPLSIVVHAFRLSHYYPGKKILIQGAGPIGLLMLTYLKDLSPGKIIISEISEKRIEIARKLYGDAITINPINENIFSRVDRITDGEGVDIIYDTTGSPSSIKSNFTLVKRGGEIIQIGIPEEKIEADMFSTVVNELIIRGSYESYNEMYDAIFMLSRKQADYSKIITSVIEIDDILNKGFNTLLEKPSEGKITVKIGGE